MADFDIDPGMRRHRTLVYENAAGEPGKVEAPPSWELSDPLMANVTVDPDGMHATIDYNGSVGDLVITSVADGDLIPGEANVNRIVIEDIFHMKAPFGATGGRSDVTEQEKIP